jgi:hypothetical protein
MAPAVRAQEGDPYVLGLMRQMNEQLQAQGLELEINEIELFTVGGGRSVNRLHQTGSRWVPNDPRRGADGDNITYLVDVSDGATASGLSGAATEAAIDRAFATWNNSEKCLENVDLVKRPDPGVDPDIVDALLGFGGFGTIYLADIVNAGWYPKALFDAVGGPGGGDRILAFSVNFIYSNPATGISTDLNGDNYLDVALNEVYYNDNFGNPGGTRPSSPWGINIAQPGIDVESVALHENGHSLGLGHFGPPPVAVMNPAYAGIRHDPLPIDHAGLCALWASWPNP